MKHSQFSLKNSYDSQSDTKYDIKTREKNFALGRSRTRDPPTDNSNASSLGILGLGARLVQGALGLPQSCVHSGSPRACSLALACWMRGGIRAPGCGDGWLFSCCVLDSPSPDYSELQDNFIHNPPQVATYKWDPLEDKHIWRRRTMIPSNVFRRRIDDDYDEETDCGVAGGGASDNILQKRIIGGRAAQFAEFPWQAHIRIGDYQCGGVLVSRWFVATAGHCVQRARAKDIAVWLGALDTRAQAPPAERHKVSQKIVHPLFRYRITQPDRYDLALLLLSRPAVLGTHVLPVCLPNSEWGFNGPLAGRTALVAGWGSTGHGSAPRGTHRLRSAIVPILSTEECIMWHRSKQISVEIHSEMICAGHSDGHQDACLGDSGGPLVIMKDGRYYLVGITSAGFGCGIDHQPGIYHNVLVTSPWIKHIIWK
ncbi:serine protease 33 [Arctopsyche grandis]|uniref:serine protease 33 n=1 Tax=Arctopsyche grandis TaxID=121162 RepID=UPI00406D6E3C